MSNTKNMADAKKRVGRPATSNKAAKCPGKNSGTDEASEESPVLYCPCLDYLDGELSIECGNCKKYWHLCCVGLRGLAEDMIASLEHWDCPDCYKCPHSYKNNVSPSVSTSVSECNTLKVIIKDELLAIQPLLRVTVENAVRKLLPKTICSKEDVQSAVKTYADVTKESQKKIIEEASLTQSSKTVVENVVRKLDADKIEREKRKLNAVVLKVPEPSKDASSEQKRKEDMEFCKNVLKMERADFETCWRAGKIDESKPDYCRPLIIQMTDSERISDWTREGKGLETESGYWVNKDLCSADRRSNFLSRQERRKRMKS